MYDDALVACWSFRYISGMVGIVDTEGNLLENEEDMGDQTTNALARVGRILAQYGATPLSILASVSHATYIYIYYIYIYIRETLQQCMYIYVYI